MQYIFSNGPVYIFYQWLLKKKSKLIMISTREAYVRLLSVFE